jgi:hypothetical protein
MKRIRQYRTHILIYTVLILSLYLFMVLMASIPNGAIEDHMRSSARCYANADRYAFTESGSFQNVTDNHADLLWLNISWQMGTGNPFISALDTKYFDGLKYGDAAGLYLTVTKGAEANTAYTRYWHGTAGILRLLHLFTDVRGAKTIGIAALLLLVLATMRQLFRHGHQDLGLCLAASLCLVQAWNLRLSVEYLPSFLICFALCPAFLQLERHGDPYVSYLSVVSGTLTAFFDFLTTETVAILIPLILMIAIRSKERRLGSPMKTFHLLLRCGLCWIVAYGVTFLLKWTAVSLATGANHFTLALDSAAKRVDGTVVAGLIRKKPGMFMSVGANLSAFFQGTSRTEYLQVIAKLAVMTAVLFGVYRLYQIRRSLRPGTMFLLMLGSVVLLRFALLANHSFMHAFFTYRALASTTLAILSAMVINLRRTKKAGS